MKKEEFYQIILQVYRNVTGKTELTDFDASSSLVVAKAMAYFNLLENPVLYDYAEKRGGVVMKLRSNKNTEYVTVDDLLSLMED